jgi:hypothetical protein
LSVDKELEILEEKLQETDDFVETPPSDIVAFNELRSCADLLRMYDAGQLNIQPEFQRDVVWSNPMQTRFVDSLVKQLPIPSMCISLDYKTQERLVIDGLQRISSIIFFLSEKKEWKLSNLDDIDSRISGKSNFYIRKKHPGIIGKVENTTIPITVLRCDYAKKSHMAYLFTIFHRLNTGGNKLTNQEIRNCIYSGPFNDLLRSAVNNEHFRTLFSLEEDKTYRFAYEELILMFFAFSENFENYRGRLAKFLNDYMEVYRYIEVEESNALESHFNNITNLIYTKICDQKPLPKLSKAASEALYVGISRNYENLENESAAQLQARFKNLISDNLFSVDSLKGGLSSKGGVISRLSKSIEIFS